MVSRGQARAVPLPWAIALTALLVACTQRDPVEPRAGLKIVSFSYDLGNGQARLGFSPEAVDRCSRLPGVRPTGRTDSFPPRGALLVDPAQGDVNRVRLCLQQMPGAPVVTVEACDPGVAGNACPSG